MRSLSSTPGASAVYPTHVGAATARVRLQANGEAHVQIAAHEIGVGVRTPGFVGHPARAELVNGKIQGEDLVQYDFTPQQYEALAKLTAAFQEIKGIQI